jgi:sugar phosphate isomerase/epimerase
MEPVISLSTSCLRKYKDGYEMLAKAADLGFKHVELGHGIPVSQVDGIEKAVADGVIKVSSLHNFCPVPPFAKPPAPNLYSPATKSKSESMQWQRHTLNTLAFAESVKASRVVMHSGELIYFFGSPKFKMQRLFEEYSAAQKALAEFGQIKEGPDETAASPLSKAELEKNLHEKRSQYESALKKFIVGAEKRAQKAHDTIFENVQTVHAQFAEKNILLGLENRDGWCELPFDTKFAEFAERLNTLSHARGWIDIGHAQVKAIRGVIDMEQFLESLRGKICAWHLHDTTADCEDHKPLGQGITDFNLVKKFFDPQSHNFILELGPSVTSEEIIESRKRLEDMF